MPNMFDLHQTFFFFSFFFFFWSVSKDYANLQKHELFALDPLTEQEINKENSLLPTT